MIKPALRRARPTFRPVYSAFARRLLPAFLMLCVSHASLLGELNPFAPALMAAALTNGVSGWALLTGAAAGALTGGMGAVSLLPAASCLLVFAVHFTLRPMRRAFPVLGEMDDFLTGMNAACSLLIPSLCLSGGISYNLITAGLSSMIAALLAPALVSGMGVRISRRLLMPEEQLSLSLLLMILLAGLRSLPYCGFFLAPLLSALIILIFSGTGAAMGALSGLAAGTALTLSGSDPFTGATLALMGLLAGCARTLPRFAACLALLAGNLLTVSWGLGYTVGHTPYPPLIAGCLVYCLLPMKIIRRLRRWILPSAPHAAQEGMAARLRKNAALRLSGVSEVFGELADGYSEKPLLPTEQQLIASLRGALCEGCEGYAECWQGDRSEAGRLMCRMAAEALTGRAVTHARELPPDLLRHCRRSGRIDRAVLPLLSDLARTRISEVRRGEARSLMSRQFREAQRILDALSTGLKSDLFVSRDYASLARAALDKAGLRVSEVIALVEDRLELVCVMRDQTWNEERARRAARLLSEETGIPFSPVLSRGRVPGECELRLRQAPALTAAFGAACLPAKEGEPCGDSHLIRLLPDGRLIAALSDGMGQGAEAARESRRCISLIRKFVSAGLEKDAALGAVNSLLLMKSGADMFATADLCVVDLYSGSASFTKLGACRSFLMYGRSIREIAGGRLPLGVLDRVEPASEKTEVQPGDMIIMMTDGIADELKEGQIEPLRALLPRLRRLPPQDAADAILAHALRREGEKDDMTVLAVRILARKLRSE